MTEPVTDAEVDALIELLKSRDGQEFAGELSLTSKEGERIRSILTEFVELRKAVRLPALEGWRMVPVEPTEDMMGAGVDAIDDQYGSGAGSNSQAAFIYRAMLAAAPAPPVKAE